jgi:hypothetical protein
MNITNPPKALIVLFGLAAITVLMITSKIEQSAGTGLIGSIVGYGIGNGIRGTTETPPIIGRKPK